MDTMYTESNHDENLAQCIHYIQPLKIISYKMFNATRHTV